MMGLAGPLSAFMKSSSLSDGRDRERAAKNGTPRQVEPTLNVCGDLPRFCRHSRPFALMTQDQDAGPVSDVSLGTALSCHQVRPIDVIETAKVDEIGRL
jgi:hypothetical protein